jgi:hypothetical protein
MTQTQTAQRGIHTRDGYHVSPRHVRAFYPGSGARASTGPTGGAPRSHVPRTTVMRVRTVASTNAWRLAHDDHASDTTER